MLAHLIVLGVLGTLSILAIWRPAIAMSAVMIVFGLEQWAQAKNGFYFQHGALLNVVCSLILLYGICMRVIRGQPVLRPSNPVTWATLGLFGWAMASIVWSTGQQYSIEQFRQKLPYLIAVQFALPLIVANTKDLVAAMRWALVICSAITLLLLTVKWEGRRVEVSSGTGVGNLSGQAMGGNPLAVASLAGWTTLIAVGLNFRRVAWIWWAPRIAIACAGVYIAFKSGSRGQFFAIFMAGVMLVPLSKRMFKTPGGFIAGLLGLAIVGYIGLLIHRGATDYRWSFGGMTENWKNSRLGTSEILLDRWLDSSPVYWLLGLGSSASFRPDILGGYPHLVMAEVLAEEGIIGLVLLWMVPIFVGRALYRMWPHIKDKPVERGAVMTMASLFMFELILSFKQGSMLGSWYAFAFAMIIGRVERTVLQQATYEERYASYADDEFPSVEDAQELDPAGVDADVFGPAWTDYGNNGHLPHRPEPATL